MVLFIFFFVRSPFLCLCLYSSSKYSSKYKLIYSSKYRQSSKLKIQLRDMLTKRSVFCVFLFWVLSAVRFVVEHFISIQRIHIVNWIELNRAHAVFVVVSPGGYNQNSQKIEPAQMKWMWWLSNTNRLQKVCHLYSGLIICTGYFSLTSKAIRTLIYICLLIF